jgi:hypothetical protein
MRIGFGAIAAVLCILGGEAAHAAAWQPQAWSAEDTVELRTQARGEEPHWFPVWLVVIDGQVYVRLGSRATERVESNTTKPILAVRVAGEEFPAVRGVPAPEMAEKVNAAMADKYWSDIGIRLFSHPLTLRLEPGDASAAAAAPGAVP